MSISPFRHLDFNLPSIIFVFFFGRLAGRSIRIAAAAVGVGAGGVGGGGGGGGGGGHGAPQASDVGERRRIVGRQTQRLAVVELGLGELAVDVQHGAQIAVRRRVLFRSFFLQKKKESKRYGCWLIMSVGFVCWFGHVFLLNLYLFHDEHLVSQLNHFQ